MSDRFYSPNLGDDCDGDTLDGPEAHHLIRVCRARVGTTVELFNGRGLRASATVAALFKREVMLQVGVRSHSDPPLPLCVACALPKGDRASFLVEKCVELGVTSLIPLATARSVTHPRDAKLEKFERIVVEACKQSGRDHLMAIESMTPIEELLRNSGDGWLFDLSGDPPPARKVHRLERIAIGPEGGWTPDEVDCARNAGWSIVRMPGYILRIETAVVAAVSVARFL